MIRAEAKDPELIICSWTLQNDESSLRYFFVEGIQPVKKVKRSITLLRAAEFKNFMSSDLSLRFVYLDGVELRTTTCANVSTQLPKIHLVRRKGASLLHAQFGNVLVLEEMEKWRRILHTRTRNRFMYWGICLSSPTFDADLWFNFQLKGKSIHPLHLVRMNVAKYSGGASDSYPV
jgi:hypothetical protein